MFEVKNDPVRRTISVRLSGFIRADEMRQFAAEYKAATDHYQGGKHLVLADMRGLRPMEPETSQIMGEAIHYARERGVAMCAHLSDSTIARLHAARIAAQASEQDDVTIDCVSPEEAQRQLIDARTRIFGLGTRRSA